jgi:carboxyl-terminal processing protease
MLAGLPSLALAFQGAAVQPVAVQAASEHDELLSLWSLAKSGDNRGFDDALTLISGEPRGLLHADAAALHDHLAAREQTRASRIEEVKKEFDKAIAEPRTDLTLSRAIRSLIEWHELSTDKASVLADARVQEVIAACDAGARAAEERGDQLTAGELFVLLDLLMDVKGTYKADVRRLGQRQEMLRLYVPERLWELRNERAKASSDKPLPPYNPFGDDWKVKLASIDQTLLERCLGYTRQHVTQKPMSELMIGGLENLRTMITTQDLGTVFPGLKDAAARASMLAFLTEQEAALANAGEFDASHVSRLLGQLERKNADTVKITDSALMHEFGAGAMSRLDEFSEIIWPDEVRRFQKATQGRFVGVGIQIEYDELQNIRVVSPIEGTPAQRAGIKPGDVIAKVDGRSIFGLSLDQAVDVITGPESTNVVLTIERPIDDPASAKPAEKPSADAADHKDEKAPAPDAAKDAAKDAPVVKKETLTFTLRRSLIKVVTVKGWKREGAKEDAWNWYIDPANKIGYVRLTQFADTSGAEFERAISEMKSSGLNALVFDLRFNPGGLLDQAVRIGRKFVNVDGPIVRTQGPGKRLLESMWSEPSEASLSHIPVIVLVNQGSASASEIVSGCVSTYAERGQLDALVLGARSYGKGSVQNVYNVTSNCIIKVTTAYYMLPNNKIIHRLPGAEEWGIEPNLKVEMLPKQTSEALLARRNADVVPLNKDGIDLDAKLPHPDPDELLTKGTDLQLETAVLLLKARVMASKLPEATAQTKDMQRPTP